MEKASVVIPIYNAEEYLPRCIESVISQTYPNIQLILIDDGSTDSSNRICKEYADQYPWMEIYRQENGGVSRARNLGLEHCDGEYVFFLDADDYILPEFIAYFMNEPECDFLGGGYIDSNGWHNAFSKIAMTNQEYRQGFESSLHAVPSVHVTGNRYDMRVINENGLRFTPTSKCGEDIRFNVAFFPVQEKYM